MPQGPSQLDNKCEQDSHTNWVSDTTSGIRAHDFGETSPAAGSL